MAPGAQKDRKDQSSQARLHVCGERGCGCWVSTDLDLIRPENPEDQPEDIEQDDKAYRRLSPDWYLWLQARFEKFQKAIGATNTNSASHTDAKAAELVRRFDALRDIAKAHYTLSDLKQAKRRLAEAPLASPNRPVRPAPTPKSAPANTRKPVRPAKPAFLFPQDGDAAFDPENMRFSAPVTEYALDQVNRIREEALTAGWTESELYQNRGRYRFPFGASDYGVACFIDPGQTLGVVTPHSIELICRGGHSLTFRRRGKEHLPLPKTHSNQEAIGS